MSVSSPFIQRGSPIEAQVITARKTLSTKSRISSLYHEGWSGLMLPKTNGKIRKGRFKRINFNASLRSFDHKSGGNNIKKIEHKAMALLFDLNLCHFSPKFPSRIQLPPTKNCDRLINSIENGKPAIIRSKPVKCKYGCKNLSGLGSISR